MPKVHTMELDSPKEVESIPKHDNPTNTTRRSKFLWSWIKCRMEVVSTTHNMLKLSKTPSQLETCSTKF